MNDYIADITLDLNCERACQTVSLTQFDKGKRLRFTVTINNAPYSLTGCDVVLKGEAPNGTRIAVDCQVENDGTATVMTDDFTFPVNGFAQGQLVISDSERSYYTQKFRLFVDNALDFDVHEDGRYSVLDRLIRQVNLIDEHGGIIVDDELSSSSTHPVQNKVITQALNGYYRVNTTDQQPDYATCDAKTIYVGAKLGNERGIIIPFFGKDKQMFIGVNGTICVRHYTGGNDYQDWEPNLSELTANKKTAINSSNQSSTVFFPSIKAVVDYLAENYLNAQYAEDIRYKIEEFGDTAPDPDDEEYPSAIAVWNFVDDAFSKLYIKHGQNSAKISDLQAYLGYTSPDILGLCVDLENKRFTRLAGAEELEAGSDFDAFPMYGGRRRCCVANDGTINAYYGEQGYAEDGTNGQVMVYQPKFYYRMVPLKLEKQASGIGYHIRKANYYVTANPHPGFKLHPLFYDANGNEIDYVLLSAYEGSMYDVSASAYVNDSVDTSVSYGEGDLLCSVAGKKPISGRLTGVGNKEQFETMANNLGTGWHLDTIRSISANQLLMMIELGTMNTQPAVGLGVVSLQNNGDYNCSSYTGSTAALGNATGMATETIAESGGTETANTTNGKLSVSYRGVENPWGNIWKHTNGVNLWGDGTGGAQVFICDDFSYNESKHDGNYKPAGFSVANDGGYVSAFGYGSEAYDWIILPSEVLGNSSLPVGDDCWCSVNPNNYRIALFGGSWNSSGNAGGFFWSCIYSPTTRAKYTNGRLLYVPTA